MPLRLNESYLPLFAGKGSLGYLVPPERMDLKA